MKFWCENSIGLITALQMMTTTLRVLRVCCARSWLGCWI